MTIHTVSPGETLNSIAVDYNLTAEYLQTINGLPNPNNLTLGQCLIILYPDLTYITKAGDTLYAIAQKHDTTVIQLMRNNPFLNSRNLAVGDLLVISFRDKPTTPIEVNGYAYTTIDLNYLSTVLPYLTYITIFTYGIQPDGTLIPADDERIIELALSFGVAPVMNLSSLTENGQFSSELAMAILNDTALQDRLVEEIAEMVELKSFYGVDVDFEFIPGTFASKYAIFIEKIRKAISPMGAIVIAALVPKVSGTQPGLLYEGHDYNLIGQAADKSFLMTYEWGYTYSAPMAVAPLNNVRMVVDYAVSEIPRDKILMGIPNYGYVWTLPYESGVSRATSLSIHDALEIAGEKQAEILYNPTSATPYFYFDDNNGTPCIVWFEDARSMQAKLELVKEYRLAGVGYWNIDRPNAQNWMLLNALFQIIQIPFTG